MRFQPRKCSADTMLVMVLKAEAGVGGLASSDRQGLDDRPRAFIGKRYRSLRRQENLLTTGAFIIPMVVYIVIC